MQLLMFFAVSYFLSSLHSHIHALIFFSVLFIVLFMRLEFLNLYIKKFSFFIYGCPTFLPITRAPDVRFASKTHHCNPLEPLHNYAKLGSPSVVHNCCLSCVRRPMPYILIFSAVRLVYPFFAPENVMYS